MNNQSNVRLINPHAKSICGRDHPQVTDAKGFLHEPLIVDRQSSMEMSRSQTLAFKERRNPLGFSPCSAINDCA